MLYGRDAERSRVWTLLERARASRSGVLVLTGEPGIGKTALLEDTRERAADMVVLSARGVESESELPFAALHQLLRPALDRIERLPEPQAAALRGALGLAAEGGQERFLVFTACLSLLSELAERRPVLCLVDDAHWLDAASADALRFVARRLDAEGIVIVFAAREGEESVFEAADLETLALGGLDADAAALLLARGTGVEAAQSVRDRIVAQTHGNALALLELPGALTAAQLAGDEPLPETLPLTRQVENVFLERVHRLPDGARRLLLVAAADDSEDVSLVVRAADSLGAGDDALDAAEHAGMLTVHSLKYEFRHPLVRSAVYEAATSSERRAAHRALANALADFPEHADRRAWHLAASALEHDETVVEALEEAAERAVARAAHAAASRALERAAELTIDDRSRVRRLAGAAWASSLAGDDEQATAIAKRALRLSDDPLQSAELARVLGIAEIRRGRPVDAPGLLLPAARAVAPLDPARALDLLLDASWASNEGGDPDSQLESYKLAASLAPAVTDDRSRFVVDLLTGLGAIAEGDTEAALPALGRALTWGLAADDPRDSVWAGTAALWLAAYDQAAILYERGAALARARGALGVLAPALGTLALQQLLAQRFDQAELAAREGLELGRASGAKNLLLMPLFVLASIAAIRGDDEAATAQANEALERATRQGMPVAVTRCAWALAQLDLGRGRWTDALARLEPLTERWLGLAGGLSMQTLPDRIEAAVRAGMPDAARVALSIFETWATRAGAPWVAPRLAGCRALLAEGDEATAHFEAALDRRAALRPFDLPRIQLVYGEHLRRERRRVDARVQLRAALEGFEALGAEPWAARARTELRATGETARKRDPSTLSQLTPQELQIARLVSEGLSNKEVAAQLFLSPRTIDAHLRNVFSKLAITSRTQLARLRLDDQAAEPAPA